jgi:hypothetical protein
MHNQKEPSMGCNASLAIVFATALVFVLGTASETVAQQKKAAPAGKREACIAKAQAENPARGAGQAQMIRASVARCMKGG